MITITRNIVDKYPFETCKTVENLAFYMRRIPPAEQLEWLEQINERIKEQRFYSPEELTVLADSQLENLAQRLNLLVKAKDIKKELANEIIKELKRRKPWAIKIASESPIRQNLEAKVLPIVPVINEIALDTSVLMKLLEVNGKIGRGLVLPNKIINKYQECPIEYYWMVDVRINEIRYDCPSLTLSETIAYAFHNMTILDKYALNPVSSRYKRGKKYPQIYLRLAEGYPIAHWSRYDYFVPITEIGVPSCAMRLIH